MSHFQLCAYVASGAVATPCVAFIDPADTRRRRSGKVWNIDARIKHPCNFSPLFLFFFFLPFLPFLLLLLQIFQINLANSGEKNDQSRSSISNYACSRNIARSNIGIDTLLYTRRFFFFFSFFSTIIEPRRIRLPLISKALETRD